MAARVPVRRLFASTKCPRWRETADSSSYFLSQTSNRCSCPSQTVVPRARRFSSNRPTYQEAEKELPRWAQTPRGMSMPFRIRPKAKNNEWKCNEDPKKLDAMYSRLLGPDEALMLTEEVKWLAVTHKSFDQGRRGFNDRLAYMG
jgi:large subunit ribosomal protein L15